MVLGQAGGIEQATYELLDAIGRVDRSNAWRLFAPRATCWEWDFPPRFRVSRHYSDAGVQARTLPFDLVHSPCGYIHPEMMESPGVLTVNDLQHLAYPQFFAGGEFDNRERLYRASVGQARQVICISEFTRQDVHARYGVPLAKLTTVWIIPSSTVWHEVPADARRGLLGAMGVTEPFLFYPAHGWAHKNHAALLQAFELALPRLPRELGLVLTGGPFEPQHPAAALMRRRALAGRVRHLGFRSPLEVRALFQGCTALVFPSLFEGFGMPVAEAIIAGKPVACSNVTSLPEIAGDAALLFDPADVDDVAARIVEIATHAELRARLSAAALARRSIFSAREGALRTLSVYQRAMAA